MTELAVSPETAALFAGGTELAQRCRALDWSVTSLGPVEDWPMALRTAVQMALECPFPINMWCGPELLLIYNDAYRDVLGTKHPASLGRPGRDVWGEIWPEISSMFDVIRGGGAPVYAENARFLMERESGPPREAWFTFSLSPIRDESGDVVAFLNVAAETTTRVRAERDAQEARAAAERAEGQLREVFAQAPAFMAVLEGPRHVFEFANEAYVHLVNHRDIIGKPIAAALPEVVAQGFVDLLDRVLATGQAHVGRATPVMLESGAAGESSLRYLDFVYQPLTDARGERVGIVVHGADVTDEVRARHEVERLWVESEQARANVQASEARYRFLADAIPVQAWTATPDGALDYVSDLTAKYFGRTPAELIGDGWLGVLHPDDVAATAGRWKQSLASGAPYEVEYRLWSAAHASYRWHLARATAQRDDHGAIIRWFGTNTEIEEQKRSERELKRLTMEALEANRAKGDFLAAMSHELRTPLNAIGGYAQLIEMGLRGPVTEEQRVDLLKIQRSKNHLDGLVSDVLNFAKLGLGKIDFRPRSISVRHTVDAVIEMVAPQLAQKALRLEPYAAPNDAHMRADVDRTRQILLNLFANALKFTAPDGTIGLDVRVEPDTVMISVRDTGIGIPTDQFDRIFEPFVQGRRSLESRDHGFGLGLAISRQLARAMGGDLTVRSEVGRGSTFTLTLPRG
ncbi:MAG TPA: ATP-binding protein [Gemmatimonadaceae bacterium]|nr:ATP-binding protein [Gemmatimonadaceae bacterium]